jgi:transcriptional regulator with XRE-family HTH domain
MTDDGPAFGARLAAGRQSAGLSQNVVAERSGLSIREISNLERGRTRSPHPDSARRLADALGLRGQARGDFLAAAGRRLARDVTACAVTTPQGRPGRADGAFHRPAGCTG